MAQRAVGRTDGRSLARRRAPREREPSRDHAPLDRAAWVEAALDALAEGGIDAVRVEPLAKRLRVTKGSFYWHFPDREALIAAMIAQWRDGRVAAIRRHTSARTPPATTLRRLAALYIRRANYKGLAIELAIRAHAHGDAAAARAVRAVDRERLGHVTALFVALGASRGNAQARAVLFYSHLFGQSLLTPTTVDAATRAAAVALLIDPAR